jgi:hypothetical protein
MESALDWMKKFDTRYRKTFDSDEDHLTQKTLKHTKSPKEKSRGGQRTLKSFLSGNPIITSQSELFDDTFNQADFAQMTRRWKEKNAEHVAAR